jgi:hypothetical protein
MAVSMEPERHRHVSFRADRLYNELPPQPPAVEVENSRRPEGLHRSARAADGSGRGERISQDCIAEHRSWLVWSKLLEKGRCDCASSVSVSPVHLGPYPMGEVSR